MDPGATWLTLAVFFLRAYNVSVARHTWQTQSALHLRERGVRVTEPYPFSRRGFTQESRRRAKSERLLPVSLEEMVA